MTGSDHGLIQAKCSNSIAAVKRCCSAAMVRRVEPRYMQTYAMRAVDDRLVLQRLRITVLQVMKLIDLQHSDHACLGQRPTIRKSCQIAGRYTRRTPVHLRALQLVHLLVQRKKDQTAEGAQAMRIQARHRCSFGSAPRLAIERVAPNIWVSPCTRGSVGPAMSGYSVGRPLVQTTHAIDVGGNNGPQRGEAVAPVFALSPNRIKKVAAPGNVCGRGAGARQSHLVPA